LVFKRLQNFRFNRHVSYIRKAFWVSNRPIINR
jgi:hypothetical protein